MGTPEPRTTCRCGGYRPDCGHGPALMGTPEPTPQDEEDLPEAQYDGEWHRWTCYSCGDVNEQENDPRGEIVTCEGCGLRSKVGS